MLLSQLAARRTEAIQSGSIPAIVDTSTTSELNLHVGSSFSTYKATTPTEEMHYVVIAEIQHIPGINSATQIGMIIDYQSFASLALKHNSEYISENHIWLHTSSVLLWEQGIVYSAALLLGVIFGAVLSATAVPLLTFTSTPTSGILSGISNDEFYAIQQIIPAHIILPLSLGLAFLALVAICVLALGAMAGVVLRPSVSQTPQLNAD